MSGGKRKKWFVIFLTLISGLAAGGCSQEKAQPNEPGQMRVVAGIPPVAGLVKEIAGERVEVRVLLPPGQNPHTYELTPRQIAALSEAKILFLVGLPFEERLGKQLKEAHPRLRLVDVGEGIPRRRLEEAELGVEGATPGEENSGGEHHHDHGEEAGGIDPHIWLSPVLLKMEARTIAAALVAEDPAHREEYEKNLVVLLARLDELHAQLEKKLAPFRGRTFYVFHPAFGYFADVYGLKQAAVEVEGKSPSPRQIARLIERAQSEGVKIIFVQPQFDPHSAQAIASAIGGAVIPLDPLASDVTAGLEEIGRKVEEALSSSGG